MMNFEHKALLGNPPVSNNFWTALLQNKTVDGSGLNESVSNGNSSERVVYRVDEAQQLST